MGGEEPRAAPPPDRDPDLADVRALQAGNDDALDPIMGRHQEALFRFVYRYVQSRETAAELVQETFVRAYFKIARFEPRARFVTWLYRIALNLCRDHVRSGPARQAARTESLDGLAAPGSVAEEGVSRAGGDWVAAGTDPAEQAASREEVERLRRAIDALPHDLKTALILTALEGRSQQECAERLGTTPKAIETRVYRARRLLGAKLGLTG